MLLFRVIITLRAHVVSYEIPNSLSGVLISDRDNIFGTNERRLDVIVCFPTIY